MRAIVVAPAAVHEVLVQRTLQWAHTFAEDACVAADEEEARALVAGRDGPVVVVWADTPRLGEVHAAGLQADLAEGGEVVVAPALDGSVYLVAMREPRPELVGPLFAQVLELAAAAGLETGMLRHERRVARDEDRRALLADPLLPGTVRAALGSG